MPNSSTTWRGWGATERETPGVVSTRLGTTVVANRMFPKVRSWFALGAPLELLSPLSVVRIVALLGLVSWPVAGLVGAVAPWACAAGLASALVVVVGLLRCTTLTARATTLFGFLVPAIAVAALVTGDGESGLVSIAVVLVAIAIQMGLFSTFVTVVVHQATSAALLVAALVVGGHRNALADAAALVLVTVLVALTVLVTTRSARAGGTIDPDTGVPNSHGMAEVLDRDRAAGPVLVCVSRLQGVAEARDALGHHVASELVRRAVEDLGQVLPAGASIGRCGDEDVLVVAPLDGDVIDQRQQCEAVVESVASAIGAGRYLVGTIEITLACHTGSTVAIPADDIDAIELIRRATLAAQTATETGVAHAEWDGRTTTLTADDLDLLTDLRSAADRGELWLAYQAKVAAQEGCRITGVEALLRWSSPRHGNVPPGRFIPLAERTGLVDRLTEWVLGEALDAQARWRAAGLDVGVAVNVSPQSLRTVDFTGLVARAVAARGVPPGALTLEVTESLAFDIPEAVERLTPLRELGIKVSIDDFGTGYTSLSVLPRLPLDELKVDQQFVRAMPTSSASDAIVRSVLELAHRLGLRAVAEGVEDAGLADRLTAYGYDVLQGYHFSRPVPEADLVALVRASAREAREQVVPLGEEPLETEALDGVLP